jgi:glycosyltransferase involved in cell wall biosynthesis
MRNRSNISLIVTLACRCLGKKNLVLYAQTPLNSTSKLSLKKKLFYLLFPKVRMTPILKHRNYEEQYPSCKRWPHNYYVPLTFPVPQQNDEKHFTKDGLIQILCIGKYRSYKNHEILVKAVSQLTKEEQHKIQITIVGQNSVPQEHEYYQNLKSFIHTLHVDGLFDLQMNRPYAAMQK